MIMRKYSINQLHRITSPRITGLTRQQLHCRRGRGFASTGLVVERNCMRFMNGVSEANVVNKPNAVER